MNLSSPAWRAVAEDALLERGQWPCVGWGVRLGLSYANASAYANADADAYANADADADAYANANANADADANAYADAYANANADANAYADAYANADADAYADADANANANADADADADASASADASANADADASANAFVSLTGGRHVRPGLYLFGLPSGSVQVLRVAWLRRVEGDEYEAINCTTPLRRGDYQTSFADVAIDGPPNAWGWTRCLPRPSPVNRFHCLGPVSLDPEKFSKVCPRPADWGEQ